MKPDSFVHLHLHTEYSLLDGACRIKDVFRHIREIGQTAAAITDHGNMYGAVESCALSEAVSIRRQVLTTDLII